MKQQLEKATADINELKADIKVQQLEKRSQCNETIRVIDQKAKLMEILTWKDNSIQNMSSQVNDLQIQLQAAVSEKLDAVARLETIEGKELALSFKEKQMNLDVEHLNNNIENLTDNLNKSVVELMAVKNDLKTSVAQFEIETKEKSEQLRIANLKVCELSETNEKLNNENEEYVRKLKEQLNESHKVMKAYDKELKAKNDLVELYKENNVDYQAENDELAAGIVELKRLLIETVDGCGILETRLKQSESDHQTLSDAQEEIITKLKQELFDANRLLKECASVDGSNQESDGENSLTLGKRMTFTEVYSQYCRTLKELRNKQQEYNILEMEMNNLINDVKEKAKDFEMQQNELKKHKATNEKLIEERQNFLVETVVAREELQNSRLRCELLQDECNKIKSFGSEYLKKFLLTMPPNELDNVNLNLPFIKTNSCSVELQKQKRELLDTIRDLVVKFHETETNYEIRDGNATMMANTCVTSTANVCDQQNVSSVTEHDLMVEDNSYIREAKAIQETKSREENLLKMEKLTELNKKLKNEVRQLNAEKSLIVAEANLSKVRNSICQQQFESLEKQNQMYVDMIDEAKVTNKYLSDEKANATKKLFTAENRLEDLQKEHRSLSDTKQSLTAEVEMLKKQLVQEKISSQSLRKCLEVMKTERLKSSTQIKMENGDSEELVNTTILQTGVVTMNSSVEDFSPSKKRTFLQSLQLTKSQQQNSVSESLQSTSSPDVDSLKRSFNEVNPCDIASSSGLSKRLRSTRKPCVPVTFLDLSGESDENEIINVCDDDDDDGNNLPKIKLQYLSEVRTRKQAQFIHDAFHR